MIWIVLNTRIVINSSKYKIQKQEEAVESNLKWYNKQNNKGKWNEKIASSKLVGVKWCDINKEWFIKGLIAPMGIIIQAN